MLMLAKLILILFGIFFFAVAYVMLFYPEKSRNIIKKAGSTNFINYGEITIRMIPAVAMIIYASLSKFPEVFNIVGWFMIATSGVLYLVPRKIHHAYAVKCADLLKPKLIRVLAPISLLLGILLIYSVI